MIDPGVPYIKWRVLQKVIIPLIGSLGNTQVERDIVIGNP